MAKNWAIVIGINNYTNLQSLAYAQRDAEAMRDFFQQEADCQQVYYFSHNSPDIVPDRGAPIPTVPTRNNLRYFLRVRFEQPFLTTGDNLWFFFSGHGVRHDDRDYLMPCDADSGDVDNSAIPISYITERLRRCGADNVIMILDACRNEGKRSGLGVGDETQQGIITIFSCSPSEASYEINELQQGIFTHVLLQGLRLRGESTCATVDRLNQFLRYRVPEVSRQYNKPRQLPYIVAEPATKLHLILLPQCATINDVNRLKLDAYNAREEGNYDLAEQLWIRVLAVSPADMEAIRALQRIALRQVATPPTPDSPSPPPTNPGSKSIPSFPHLPISLTFPISPTRQPSPVLRSEKGVDYSHLRDLLAEAAQTNSADAWKAADQETLKVMEKALGKEWTNWSSQDLLNFPCADLLTIDQLWVHYSSGHFGFSVQKEIYVKCGAKLDGKYPGDEIWKKFCTQVGWRVNDSYISYSEVTFNTSSPRGHLPFLGGGGVCCGNWFSRIETCKV